MLPNAALATLVIPDFIFAIMMVGLIGYLLKVHPPKARRRSLRGGTTLQLLYVAVSIAGAVIVRLWLPRGMIADYNALYWTAVASSLVVMFHIFIIESARSSRSLRWISILLLVVSGLASAPFIALQSQVSSTIYGLPTPLSLVAFAIYILPVLITDPTLRGTTNILQHGVFWSNEVHEKAGE